MALVPPPSYKCPDREGLWSRSKLLSTITALAVAWSRALPSVRFPFSGTRATGADTAEPVSTRGVPSRRDTCQVTAGLPTKDDEAE